MTTAQVKANPGLIPLQPFAQDMFPALANKYIPGSASANLFYDAYAQYAGSWTDTINDTDRVRQANGGCLVVTGCNTFFPVQDSGLYTYTNAGKSAYHAMTISLRRTVTHGWGYDFNYTWSHAIDNGSGIGSPRDQRHRRPHQPSERVRPRLRSGAGRLMMPGIPSTRIP